MLLLAATAIRHRLPFRHGRRPCCYCHLASATATGAWVLPRLKGAHVPPRLLLPSATGGYKSPTATAIYSNLLTNHTQAALLMAVFRCSGEPSAQYLFWGGVLDPVTLIMGRGGDTGPKFKGWAGRGSCIGAGLGGRLPGLGGHMCARLARAKPALITHSHPLEPGDSTQDLQ